MKISDRDKKIILFILLVAIIALPIFLFIRPKNEDIKSLNNELVSLNERYNYLKDLSAKQPKYESEIQRLNAERDSIISGYPGGVLLENTILFMRATELKYDENFIATVMAFADDEETVITEGAVNSEGNYVEGLTAIKNSTTCNYNGEYNEVLDFIDYIFNQKDTMRLSMMTLDLDNATNMIKGTFILDQYAINGNGKEVNRRDIPDMQHGTDRLFDLLYDEEGNVLTYWSSIGVETGEAEEEIVEENTEIEQTEL